MGKCLPDIKNHGPKCIAMLLITTYIYSFNFTTECKMSLNLSVMCTGGSKFPHHVRVSCMIDFHSSCDVAKSCLCIHVLNAEGLYGETFPFKQMGTKTAFSFCTVKLNVQMKTLSHEPFKSQDSIFLSGWFH